MTTFLKYRKHHNLRNVKEFVALRARVFVTKEERCMCPQELPRASTTHGSNLAIGFGPDCELNRNSLLDVARPGLQWWSGGGGGRRHGLVCVGGGGAVYFFTDDYTWRKITNLPPTTPPPKLTIS